MISVTADDRWLVKDLGCFVEPVELLDDDGKLIGLFVPANLERGKQLYADLDANTDWAELERRAAAEAGQGVTLREVLEHLLPLTTDPVVRADLQAKIDDLAAREGCPTP